VDESNWTYKIGICCLSDKHTALRSKIKDWLAGLRILFPIGVTCLTVDRSFSELAL
jgi:hypothetical protein